MSAANRDDKLVSIRSKFGMWGVGVYWTLVEKVAEQMEGKMPVPIAVLSVNETISFCGCKRNKLKTFLKHLQNVRGMNYELNGDILKIECSKLLEIKDNYTKDLEETSKRLPSKEVEEEVEEEVDTEVEKEKRKKDARPLSVGEVESLFGERGYPKGEAAKFWNYYEANGWRVGKNPMKDWRAAAAGWAMRSKEYGAKPGKPPVLTRKSCRECAFEYDPYAYNACPKCHGRGLGRDSPPAAILDLVKGMGVKT